MGSKLHDVCMTSWEDCWVWLSTSAGPVVSTDWRLRAKVHTWIGIEYAFYRDPLKSNEATCLCSRCASSRSLLSDGGARNMQFPTWLDGPAQHQARRTYRRIAAATVISWRESSLLWCQAHVFGMSSEGRGGGDWWRLCVGAQVSACAVHRQTGAKISTLVSSIALHQLANYLHLIFRSNDKCCYW
jgi:hypothetical protein